MTDTVQPIKVRGFYRVQITGPDGQVVGDSGEQENLITNAGFRYYLCYLLGAIAGSIQVSHMALGTGGTPATGDTSLGGEVVKRAAVTVASSGSTSVQFTATFDSSSSFVTSTQNISNIGLINSSNNGTLFSGNTFNSSSCATNQTVNATYRITFA
jgi:hypothetical protein